MAEEPSVLERKIKEIRREAEERDAERRAKQSGFPYLDPGKAPVSIDALKLIPEEKARAAKVAAIQIKAKEVAVAAYDPASPAAQQVGENLKAQKWEPKFFTFSMSGLEQAWHLYKFAPTEAKEITGKVDIENQKIQDLSQRLTTFQAVAAEFQNFDFKKGTTSEAIELILAGALGNHASDIHLEAKEGEALIRFRLDGILHDIVKIPATNYEKIVSRVKLLSGLKINVKGEPQDGRFTIELGKKEVEVRVSIIPSEFGDTIVLRLLDPDSISVELNDLGLRADDLDMVKVEIKKPHGLILNTGPTGSGKTTTLYAFLKSIANSEIKVITVEDPIEYRIPVIEQTQVDPEAGYTFAKGLRAIVRQDPDVILIGEIRDLETADIALQASLTGHMVLSTVHANDALGAVPRLIDLGAKPVTIGPALNLVIAQRLVRKLCEKCKQKIEITTDLAAKIKSFLEKLPERVDRAPYANPVMYKPVGCEVCNGLGYKGRIGIFEFLKGGEELADAIAKEVTQSTMRLLSEKQNMVRMQEDGILKAIQGVTTLEEVEGTTGPIEWK
jgi:type IV pilus assembly protein PilB